MGLPIQLGRLFAEPAEYQLTCPVLGFPTVVTTMGLGHSSLERRLDADKHGGGAAPAEFSAVAASASAFASLSRLRA